MPSFGAMALFVPRKVVRNTLRHIFWPISPEPSDLQTSNLYQIVALNMFIIKGYWIYGANFDTLGAGSQTPQQKKIEQREGEIDPLKSLFFTKKSLFFRVLSFCHFYLEFKYLQLGKNYNRNLS